MNAQQVIDSIESDISRVRNLDAALLASLIARLDELRKAVKWD
jgi:ABC-type transporter Mla MlaB component